MAREQVGKNTGSRARDMRGLTAPASVVWKRDGGCCIWAWASATVSADASRAATLSIVADVL